MKNKKNLFVWFIFCMIVSFILPGTTFAQAFKRLGLGETAPEISLKDMNGVNISTSSFKNKNVLAVIFFKYPSLRGATALAYWQKLYDTYQVTNGLEIVAVYCPQTDEKVTNEELENVKKIIAENKLTFPVLIDEGLAVFGKIGVISLPSSAILDKNGSVNYILAGFPEFGAERDIRINLKKSLGIPEEIIVKKEEYQPKNKADFTLKLALVVSERGNTAKAIEHLLTAIEKDPDYVLAYVTLGKFYMQEGKKEKAIESL
ncbi:MAG: redoxin domain-containing protein, partial [Candidatus Firestonebacteria bacterium]|nr:redoxin domain-containing protein [Candidatus Firestonebacteria bacterium]